ncbi:MAG: SLC13 family permease [Gammaproteobacteria bacterium]|nr:SLC13 family permease [Gammaproteobacteria bacterium]
MGWEAWFSLGVVCLCFALLAFTWVAPDVIMVAGLTLLLISGILEPFEALAGFSNEGMLTVAALYVVVSGLTETGAVSWIVQSILGKPRSTVHAQSRLMFPVALLSAFLNNTPVVAIFIPAVWDWSRRHRLVLSRLMIPLSFASIAGGTCTLVGSSTNLVVNGMLNQTLDQGLSMFELAWLGLPVVATVIIYLLLVGSWLLPDRKPALNRYDGMRRYSVEMLVEPGSPLADKSIEEAGLRQLPGLFLVEIEREGEVIPAVPPYARLRAGDRLVFVGIVESVLDLQKIRGLTPATDQLFKLGGARRDRCFVEAVVSDSCPLVGYSVRKGRFRTRYNAVIIALGRSGKRVESKIGDIILRTGDTLLLESKHSFVEQQRNSQDFFLVSALGDSHPLHHEGALRSLCIVGLMVVSVATGWLGMLEAALVASGLMIAAGCTSSQVARRAPDWQILVVIAASFGIGVALDKTGAAQFIAGNLITMAQGDPWLTLGLVFLVTALFTALATNNVAAVLVFPIAVSAAETMQVSVIPFAVTIMIAASASFATPIGYQTNLMVYNAGGYRFGDFVRIGLPLTFLVGAITVILAPLVWEFR